MVHAARRTRIVCLALMVLWIPSASQAAEAPPKTSGIHELQVDIAVLPARYTDVKGDATRFRALHWMNDGYAGGVEEFTLKGELADDIELDFHGHAIEADGDYEAELELVKEDLGFLKFDFTQFRKYYPQGGGYYPRFLRLNSIYTDKELALNIGKIGIEAGLRLTDLPDIDLLYEREFKHGAKSRLTWATAFDTSDAQPGTVQKKITPSWQEIDETVDTFEVRLSDTTKKGLNWKAEQRWDIVRASNMRYERNHSVVAPTSATADAGQKQRLQFTEPRSDRITTTLGADKWFWKDKGYASSGYRFSQMQARELENIYELDQFGRIMNFSNNEQVRDSYSDNLFTSHTWVGSFLSHFADHWTGITRVKTEMIRRRSESTYQKDNTGGTDAAPVQPDGRIDQIDVSNTEEKLVRTGQSLALRYTGIPRLAIYNEYEFEQDRSDLNENRTSRSAGETFDREDIAHMQRYVQTLGANYSPWAHWTFTAQARHRLDDITYNHVRYTNNSTSGAKSVFVDAQKIDSDEGTLRVRWRPNKYVQPSFSYQLLRRQYGTWGLPDSDIEVISEQVSDVYTWDVVSQPVDELLVTVSFSMQDGWVSTPAGDNASTSRTPSFDFDVYSALFSAEYSLNKDLSLTFLADHSRASNYNDFSAIGMPYGTDFTQDNLTFGCRWQFHKDWTAEPKLALYRYDAGGAETGSFNAQVVWLELKSHWG